jgi:hypothetical protein
MSGGALGTGGGGLLGTLAGVALAPETGGLSLAIPAATGAAGAEIGNVATGNTVNPLLAAFMGGVGGAVGGGAGIGSDLGIPSNMAGLFDSAGSDVAPQVAGGNTFAVLDNAGTDAGTAASGAGIPDADTVAAGLTGQTASDVTSGGANLGAGSVPGVSGSSAAPSSGNFFSNLFSPGTAKDGSIPAGWFGNPKNALATAMLGETALSGIQSLLPKPKVNVGQTAAQVEATDPGWNATIPSYTMQNTAAPYTGNWYTYGQTPQAPLYNAMPVQQSARGGMIHGYAAGGKVPPSNRVNPLVSVMPRLGSALSHSAPVMRGSRFPGAPRGFAMGGVVPQQPMPQPMPKQGIPARMPPQGMAPPQRPMASPAPRPQINPLAIKAAYKIGYRIGKHLKAHGYDPRRTPDGKVQGNGGGQDDLVPARLSDGEYVVPADAVAALGDGSGNQGGKKLDKMVHNVRAHKVSKNAGFPPKSKKNPLSYAGAS